MEKKVVGESEECG